MTHTLLPTQTHMHMNTHMHSCQHAHSHRYTHFCQFTYMQGLRYSCQHLPTYAWTHTNSCQHILHTLIDIDTHSCHQQQAHELSHTSTNLHAIDIPTNLHTYIWTHTHFHQHLLMYTWLTYIHTNMHTHEFTYTLCQYMWTHIHTNTSTQTHVKSHRLLPTHVFTHSHQHQHTNGFIMLLSTHTCKHSTYAGHHIHMNLYTLHQYIHALTSRADMYMHIHASKHCICIWTHTCSY